MPSLRRGGHVAHDAVAVLSRDDRTKSLLGSSPGPTVKRSSRSVMRPISSSAMSPTATTTLIAMHRSPAEPNPALIAASAAMSRSASGKTTMLVLGSTERLHALAVRGAGEVHVTSDRGRADEAHRVDARVLEEWLTVSASLPEDHV